AHFGKTDALCVLNGFIDFVDKLGFLSFDELVDVFDIHALQMAVSKNGLLEHEMLKLESQLAKAQKNQDIEGSQVVKDLRSENAQDLELEKDFLLTKSEEVAVLSSKHKAATLEKTKFVKDFLPFVDLKDMQDYHLEAEKLFDEATEAFYKLEFPYISLLSEKADQSLEELSSVEAPSI
ncbi:hypothetical protein Tco_1322002, partial [Tanacetum coccineum]